MASNRRRDTGREPNLGPLHFWPGEGRYWRWPGASVLCRTVGSPVHATGDRKAVTCKRCLARLRSVAVAETPRAMPWPPSALRRWGMLAEDAPSAPPPWQPLELRPRIPAPSQPSPLLGMAARWRGHASELFRSRATIPGAFMAASVLNSAAAELEDLVEQIRKGAA